MRPPIRGRPAHLRVVVVKVEEVGGGGWGGLWAHVPVRLITLAQGSLHMQAADASRRCLSLLAQAALLALAVSALLL